MLDPYQTLINFLICLTDCHRHLLHAMCWTPVRQFTTKTMEATVSCWDWLLAARRDLNIEVYLDLSMFNAHISYTLSHLL